MRIWVTGVGVVSPLGAGASRTMDGVLARERAFAPLSLFELEGCRARLAAEVDLKVADVAPHGEAEQWSRADAMALTAAREALRQAGATPARHPTELVVGGTTAGMFEAEQLLATMTRDPSERRPNAALRSHPLWAPSDRVHQCLGPFTRVRSVCSACSGGANAIALAAGALRQGRVERVLAGGVDALCRLTYAGFAALGAIDPQPCRPFDRRRAGLSLGEGAGFLLLETESAGRARGATPLAELRGWAIGAEATHITHPEAGGATAARVMRTAIASAGLEPEAVDYVNAHGTATPHNDSMEAAALRTCFREHVTDLAVSSTKGCFGHTLAAAGAIEAAVTVMAIGRGQAPATAGLEQVDPACALHHIDAEQRVRPRVAISNAFGFGGTDTVLLFTEQGYGTPPEAAPRHSVVITGGATLDARGLEAVAVAGELTRHSVAASVALELPTERLDAQRARRMERAARMATLVTERALAHANEPSRDSCGLIVGSAWGNVSGTGGFLRRVFERGARFAPPALFPSVLPSTLASHASIYLGLRGAVLSSADAGASAESAWLNAAELIASGDAPCVVAAATEEHSEVAELASGPTCCELPASGKRAEGASAIVLESRANAVERGARPLAELGWWGAWRDGERPPSSTVPAPRGDRPLVVMARPTAAQMLDELADWHAVERETVAPHVGHHEAIGGMALALAVARLAAGEASSVLLLGDAPDRGYGAWLIPAGGTESAP